MNSDHLEDRIRWGLNAAARGIGALTDAYRPSDTSDPLAAKNRYLRLHAAFSSTDGKFARAIGYGDALWQGIFDASYTRVGDYLVQGDACWFVARQSRLMPVMCVRTNRTISLCRAAPQSASGINTYGGVTAATTVAVMTSWPASVLLAAREGKPLADLPSDTSVSFWSVLVPACRDVVLRTGDLMSDDLGRSGVVATSELTDMGWRLAVRQATT